MAHASRHGGGGVPLPMRGRRWAADGTALSLRAYGTCYSTCQYQSTCCACYASSLIPPRWPCAHKSKIPSQGPTHSTLAKCCSSLPLALHACSCTVHSPPPPPLHLPGASVKCGVADCEVRCGRLTSVQAIERVVPSGLRSGLGPGSVCEPSGVSCGVRRPSQRSS